MPLRIFIASSREALPDATRLAVWIESVQRGHEAIVWTRVDQFPAGGSVWEHLMSIAKSIDGAMIVFGRDDKVDFRGRPTEQPRDNALVEFGLFAGALGPDRVAFCAQRGVKIPTDLEGIVALDIPDKTENLDNTSAQKVDVWLQKLEKNSPIPAPVSEKENAQRMRTALDVLVQAVYGTNRANDTISNIAGELLVRDVMDGLVPEKCLASHAELTIERFGDGICRVREEMMFADRELTMFPFTIGGDYPVTDVAALKIKAFSRTAGYSVRTVVANSNRGTQHTVFLVFQPPVPAGTVLSYELTWLWPKMWERLADGHEDYWQQPIISRNRVPSSEVLFRVHSALPALSVENRGRAGGQLKSGPVVAPDGYKEYTWEITDFDATQSVNLWLLPVVENPGIV